jgi:hypothetical protein
MMQPRIPLPKDVYENNLLGQMAISILGDEDAGDLFMLLKDIACVGLSAGNVKFKLPDGEEFDMLPDPETPVLFQKPYLPRTIEIVRHLEAKGYLRLNFTNSKGCGYNVTPPADKSERVTWSQAAVKEICDFAAERAGMMTKRRTREQKVIPDCK